jgi:hypothetical protein
VHPRVHTAETGPRSAENRTGVHPRVHTAETGPRSAENRTGVHPRAGKPPRETGTVRRLAKERESSLELPGFGFRDLHFGFRPSDFGFGSGFASLGFPALPGCSGGPRPAGVIHALAPGVAWMIPGGRPLSDSAERRFATGFWASFGQALVLKNDLEGTIFQPPCFCPWFPRSRSRRASAGSISINIRD